MRLFFSKNSENCSGKNLFLFFNGWGMDEKPFLPLLPDKEDCLIVFDYQNNEDEKLLSYLSHYQKIVLLSWSMGVWCAQSFFLNHVEQREKIELALAINGTLDPINEIYGISPKLFENMATDYSKVIRDRFYRQMCGHALKEFMDNEPDRELVNQQLELKKFLSIVKPLDVEDSIYHRVLISSKDYIVPTKSQKRFWQDSKYTVIEGSHFPFYGWDDLSTCIQDCKVDCCL